MNKYIVLLFILLLGCSNPSPKENVTRGSTLDTEVFIQENWSDTLIPYRKGDKWGYANPQKEIVVKPVFRSVTGFSAFPNAGTGYALVSWEKDKYYTLSKSGKILTKEFTIHDDVFGIIESATIYGKIGEQQGFINKYGRFVNIPNNVAYYHFFDFAKIYDKNQKEWLLLNQWGEKKLEFKGKEDDIIIFPTKHPTKIISKATKYGLIDTMRKVILPPIYDSIHIPQYKIDNLVDNSCLVHISQNGYWGVFDIRTKKILIPIKYKKIAKHGFRGNILAVQENQGYYFLNLKGEKISNITFDDAKIYDYGRDFVLITVGNQFKLYNYQGEIIIPLAAKQEVRYFEEARVFLVHDSKIKPLFSGGKYRNGQLYNYRGEPISKLYKSVLSHYGTYKPADKDLILVQNDLGKYGFMNLKGEEVIPCQYDEATPFHYGVACVHKNGGAGYIDRLGNVIIELKYKHGLRPNIYNNYVFVKTKNEKIGYVSYQGVEFFED